MVGVSSRAAHHQLLFLQHSDGVDDLAFVHDHERREARQQRVPDRQGDDLLADLVLLRRLQPNLPRPYRMWLYPLPCLLALGGWLYLYATADWLFIALGLATLTAGAVAFLVWSWQTGRWPFRAAA